MRYTAVDRGFGCVMAAKVDQMSYIELSDDTRIARECSMGGSYLEIICRMNLALEQGSDN